MEEQGKAKIMEFIEQYFPNYHTSIGISLLNDLQKLIDNESEQGDESDRIKQSIISELSGKYFMIDYEESELYQLDVKKEIERQYNEVYSGVLEISIIEFLKTR